MSREYVKDEEIIETRWKCPSCGADNRGRDMKCPACGAPKDEASRYEIDEGAQAVVDEEQLADATAGEHWVCAFCEKQNRGRKRVCQYCGADQRREKKPPRPDEAPAPAPKQKSKALVGCLVTVAALGAVVALLVWLGSPRRTEGKVTGLAWEQSLVLKAKTRVAKEGWHDELPPGALDRACSPKHRRDRKVVDHYVTVSRTRQVKYQSGSHEECRTETKDLGTGYAKRQTICKTVPEYDYRTERYTEQEPVYRDEPVHEDWCRYAVHEWPARKTARRAGEGTAGLAWPEASELGAPGCRPCAEVRDGPEGQTCCDREARYRVTFQDLEEPDKPLPVYEAKTAEEYAGFSAGQAVPLSVDDDKVSVVREGP